MNHNLSTYRIEVVATPCIVGLVVQCQEKEYTVFCFRLVARPGQSASPRSRLIRYVLESCSAYVDLNCLTK